MFTTNVLEVNKQVSPDNLTLLKSFKVNTKGVNNIWKIAHSLTEREKHLTLHLSDEGQPFCESW